MASGMANKGLIETRTVGSLKVSNWDILDIISTFVVELHLDDVLEVFLRCMVIIINR